MQSPCPTPYPARALKNNPPITWRDRARNYKQELLTYREIARTKGNSEFARIKFCVLSLERSGSTLLFDMANTHPQIQCEAHAKQAEILGKRYLWPRRYIEFRAGLCPVSAYGFKLQLNNLVDHNPTNPQHFIQSLHGDSWKFIYLTRRNVFRQGLSLCIANQTQVWHHVRGSDGQIRHLEKSRQRKECIVVDCALLLDYLNYLADSTRYTEYVMQDIPHLKMEYEDDLFTTSQQANTMARVFDYLDLPPHTVSTSFIRTGSDDWRDRVANTDEVFAAVRDTRFESFLDAT